MVGFICCIGGGILTSIAAGFISEQMYEKEEKKKNKHFGTV